MWPKMSQNRPTGWLNPEPYIYLYPLTSTPIKLFLVLASSLDKGGLCFCLTDLCRNSIPFGTQNGDEWTRHGSIWPQIQDAATGRMNLLEAHMALYKPILDQQNVKKHQQSKKKHTHKKKKKNIKIILVEWS